MVFKRQVWSSSGFRASSQAGKREQGEAVDMQVEGCKQARLRLARTSPMPLCVSENPGIPGPGASPQGWPEPGTPYITV